MVTNMLHRKLLRDVWHTRWQFISVVLTSALGILVFAGLDGAWRDMEQTSSRYYAENHLADFWVIQSRFTEADVARLGSIDGVDRVGSRTTAEARVQLPNSPTLRVHVAAGAPTVNELVIVEEDQSLPAGNGLYLEYEFAEANNLAVGDELTLRVDQFEQTRTIRGLVRSPEYLLTTSTAMISDHESYGFAWIFPAEGPLRNLPITEATLTIEPGADPKQVQQTIQELFPDAFVYDRSLNVGYASYISDIDAMRNLSTMLPMLFVMVSALVVMSTMKRLMENQRGNIGILHSLGYSRLRIATHVLAFAFIPTAVGAILGVALGRFLVPMVLWPVYDELYVQPERATTPVSATVIAITVGVVALSTLVGYLSIRNLLQQRPSELLRPLAPASGSVTLLERWHPMWSRLGFNGKMVLRNLGRQRSRTLMAFAGVLVSTTLIVASFGMMTSMSATIDHYYDDRLTYDLYVTVNPDSESVGLEPAVDAGRIDLGETIPVEVSSEERTITTQLLVMESDQASIQIGELPDDGVVMPANMAADLGLQPGDSIRLHALGADETLHLTIARLVDIPISIGFYASVDYWENASGTPFTPTQWMIADPAPDARSQLAQLPMVDNVEDLAEQKSNSEQVVNANMQMIYVLIVMAILLGVVVLYTMGTLNLLERVREFATLKVLGYFQSEVRRILVAETLLVSIIAAIIGVVAGYFMIGWVMEASVPKNMTIPTSLTWWVIPLSLALTIGFSWLVQLVVARQVRTIDMVSALKSVE